MSSTIWSSIFVILILWSLKIHQVRSKTYRTEHDDVVYEISENLDETGNYRLSKSIKPTAYEIRIEFGEDNFTSFEGEVSIQTIVEVPTNRITLHSKNLFIESVKIEELSPEEISIQFHNDNEQFTIVLNSTVSEGKSLTIGVKYGGRVCHDMSGIYRSAYVDKKKELRWIVATQFQKTHARKAFPCFDEPKFKATFKLSIVTPPGYKCLSNMPLDSDKIESKKDVHSAKNVHYFKSSKEMSTYLVAFFVSKFAKKGNSEGNFTVWSQPDAIDQGRYALEIGPRALKKFENLFGSEYQLPKMDMVALPDSKPVAVENWGLITFRENELLYSETDSSDLEQQTIATTIVHECAHMWFGNLVSPEWWSSFWLSEGFARFYEYRVMHELEPSWRIDQQFIASEVQAAFEADVGEYSLPMTREVTNRYELAVVGGPIIYAKAACIIRMMELTFGPDIFNAAMRDYLKENKYSVANPDDLWEVLQDTINGKKLDLEAPVNVIMNSWTEQAGFPVVSVNITGSVAHLSQKRFVLKNVKPQPKKLWWIPITWTTKKNRDFESTTPKYWLKTESDHILLSNNQLTNGFDDQWTIFNVQKSGFYRVNYDRDSWIRIIRTLHSDDFEKIHENNRAAIVDDLLNLARADLVDYKTAFTGIDYLKRETNYIPFQIAFSSFNYLLNRFAGQPNYKLLKDHLLSIIDPIRRKLGFDDGLNEDRPTRLLRQAVNNFACKLDESNCVENAIVRFKGWVVYTKPVVPNLRGTVYCTALRHGTEVEWQFLWQKYLEANSAAEQVVILKALACTRHIPTLEKYLLFALEDYSVSRIRKQHIMMIFDAVYSSGIFGAEYILEFVRKHYQTMKQCDIGFSIEGEVLSRAAEYYSTQELIDKFEIFIQSHFRIPNYPLEEATMMVGFLNECLQSAKNELAWYQKNEKVISEWIKKNSYSCNTTGYQLPGNIVPLTYLIKVKPYIEVEKFTFDGEVKINTIVAESTKTIVLHALELEIHSVIVNGKPVPMKSISYELQYHFLFINLNEALIVGDSATIVIKYSGILNDAEQGFYRSSYIDDSGQTRWLATTHLQPVYARRMFPCFDEPAMKAKFVLSVSRPANYSAISNTPLHSQAPDGSERVWDTFDVTPKMSTYLVALVVSDFQPLIKEDKYFYRVWSKPRIVEQGAYALSLVPPLVKFYEEKLQYRYELSKLDIMAIADFPAGAMENWGLLIYIESEVLYNPSEMTLETKQQIGGVTSHEIAHQWFGNLVTPTWWKYIWLSEGLAAYIQYLGIESVETNWNSDSRFVVDRLHSVLRTDSKQWTSEMTYDVYSPGEIVNRFNGITFSKAASVFRMMAKSFGLNLFYEALKDYLKMAKFGTVTPDDLSAAFQNQIDLSNLKLEPSIKTIMDSWSTQPSYPLVQIYIEGKTATLSQERFYRLQNEQEPNDRLWWIPITWASKSNPDFNKTAPKFWFSKKNKTITLDIDDEWVIFNVQQTGFYRVNYDLATWHRIVNLLKSEDRIIIHEINRAAILDDLFALAMAGKVDYTFVLSATEYLRNETSYIPWKAALRNFEFLRTKLMGTELHEHFQTHMRTLLIPILGKLKITETPYDTVDNKLLRSLVVRWACKMDLNDCVFPLMMRYSNWRQYNIPLPAYMRETAYCVAIQYDEGEIMQFMLSALVPTNSEIENLRIIDSLTCTNNRELLLTTAITNGSKIPREYAERIFEGVYTSDIKGLDFTIDFLQTNFVKIAQYFGGHKEILNIMEGISNLLSTPDLVAKFEKLGYIISPYLAKDWYQNNRHSLYEFLESNYGTDDFMLPTKIVPSHYELYLSPYFDENSLTFDGSVTIDAEVASETSAIILHAKNLKLISISILENDINPVGIRKRVFFSRTEQLGIYLDKTISIDSHLKIQLNYTGLINDEMVGLYRSWYTDEKGTLKWLVVTQLEPIYARRVFPCFDEPIYKATFTIHIRRRNNYQTISNMPHVRSEPAISPDYTWDSYAQSLRMSTYLVSFVISEFAHISGPHAGIVSIWGNPNVIYHGVYALNVAPKLLEAFEHYTGHSYTMGKLDTAAIPDMEPAAMENWGLITIKENNLLEYDEGFSAKQKKSMYITLAHEIAHMWFGNLVTCEWWSYNWMQEGFATFFGSIIGDRVAPEYHLEDQMVIDYVHMALKTDSSITVGGMNQDVLEPDEIIKHWDQITYSKSLAVIRMWYHCFGRELFDAGIQTYLKNGQYKTVNPKDLANAFTMHENLSPFLRPDKSIEDVMNSWTYSSGFPVITVSWDNQILTVDQQRYFQGKKTIFLQPYLYLVPISYTKQSVANFDDTSPDFWLLQERASFPLTLGEHEWVILNIRETGYYRVNYSKDLWDRIIRELGSSNFTRIHEINRAQIIDDVFNLAEANYTDYNMALSISQYLVQEKQYLPWKAFFNAYEQIDRRFADRSIGEQFRKYVLQLINCVYSHLGFEDKKNEDMTDQLNRELILSWACQLGHGECVDRSEVFFNDWQKNKSKVIPVNARSAVFCTAVKYGDDSNWWFLWKRYKELPPSGEKWSILKSLGCSRNKKTLIEYVKLALFEKAVRRDDLRRVFTSIVDNNEIGIDAMLDFLKIYYNEMKKYPKDVHSILVKLALRISSPKRITEFMDLLKILLDDAGSSEAKSYDEYWPMARRVQKNLLWSDDHYTTFNNFLSHVLHAGNAASGKPQKFLQLSTTLLNEKN